MTKKTKALVVLSGGQDSTTCLYWAKENFDEVLCITFDYNQRHSIELDCAKKISEIAGVEQEVIRMGEIFKGLSPLTDKTKSVEQYESADTLPGGLENTFVPGRNMMFLTVAANRAYVHECDTIVIGVSQEDYGGYPDCRSEYIEQMEKAIEFALDKKIKIATPLINLNKKQTVEMAKEFSGCMDALSYSHTCYNGVFPPCGKCHSCLLRLRGFEQAGETDPIYRRVS
ncbi:7-cyano-7-deazaguanine synthase QueC [Gynuella sunshinyii]|uniref:7-cyano-7-deazaguanine synthase n=1 Tax=Gynuella sunshinyii YC6258 TaxID=1445510 RepID=A0A0C5VET2_9GAMM|nr:7-cyano-7-deazaguanine synthase QueC [Gynuella sunshinyii]AJQ93082.1 putative PP-loop superfamily ATPase [Gynuella sunshinyii YC6258]